MPDKKDAQENTLTLNPRRKRLYLQNLAALLDYHKNGQTLKRVFRRQAKQYLGIIVGIGLLCFVYHVIHIDSIAWLVAGMGIGMIYADVRLIRISVALWPLQKRFIDWSRVREWNDRISSKC